MPKMFPDSPDDADGQLPKNQPLIETRSVKRLFLFLDTARSAKAETGYTCMGTVTGRAGLGKSVAVAQYMSKMKLLTHTGAPAGLLMKVGNSSTPRALAKSLVEHLQERPRGRNTTELVVEAAEDIQANDLQLIAMDECNRLNERTFDMLRDIHDRSGCPIVLVGLPNLLKVIKSQEQFDSRVRKRMDFRPLTSEEVLQVVFPQLIIPFWRYNAECPEDLAMGTYLIRRVGLSWRNLRSAIAEASQFALRKRAECITPDMLRAATRSVGAKPEQEAEKQAPPEEAAGPYERASEDRHAGKTQTPPDESPSE